MRLKLTQNNVGGGPSHKQTTVGQRVRVRRLTNAPGNRLDAVLRWL
jgi:hypothetical protein